MWKFNAGYQLLVDCVQALAKRLADRPMQMISSHMKYCDLSASCFDNA